MKLVILGIDPGRRRYGIAVADPETRFARPLEIIDAQEIDPVDRIVALVNELRASCVVIGRPLSLSGAAGPAVDHSDELATSLRARVDAEVVQFDERLTTVMAEQARRSSGARNKRSRVDAVAAQLMLQGYLDSTTR